MSDRMHLSLRTLMGGALGLAVFASAPAQAATVQIGSDLSADATIIEAHQQDSMFWANTIAGKSFSVPADGQITKAWVKGMALQQAGAGPPLNKIAFQVVRRQADGSLKIPEGGGSSAPFDLPYTGDQNQVTEYNKIENLCVKAGDFVAFNNRGGWQYAGTDANPDALNPNWYQSGAPFRVFGAVGSSSTYRYTQHDGTKNGMTVTPGAPRDGSELLMRLELTTGKEVSQSCGGPPRHANGDCVYTDCAMTKPNPATDPGFVEMRLVHPDGGIQRAYVLKKTRAFQVGAYCASPTPCSGTATLTRTVRIIRKGKPPKIEERTVATAPFTGAAQDGFKIDMKVTKRLFKWVRSGKKKTRTVTMTLASSTGKTFVEKMQLGN